MWRSHSRADGLGGALLLVCCLPEFEQVQGENVLYEYPSGFTPCAENAAHTDQLVSHLEQRLGITAPERLRFSWIEDGVVPSWAYGEGAGYTIGRHAMSYNPVSIHELTHATMGTSISRFFTEGVAVAMEITVDPRGPRYVNESMFHFENWDPRPTMLATRSTDVNYGVAGAFVTYLLVQYGPERFTDFYRSLNGPVTKARIEAKFRDVYALDLDAVVEVFLEGVPPSCPSTAFPIPPVACAGPTIPWESDWYWRIDVSMACDEPGVIGGIGREGAWASYGAVTVEVPEDGRYFLYSSDTTDEWLRFGPCFGCPWDDPGTLLENGLQGKALELTAGKYYVRIGSQSDRDPEVTVRLEVW